MLKKVYSFVFKSGKIRKNYVLYLNTYLESKASVIQHLDSIIVEYFEAFIVFLYRSIDSCTSG